MFRDEHELAEPVTGRQARHVRLIEAGWQARRARLIEVGLLVSSPEVSDDDTMMEAASDDEVSS